MSVNGFDDSKNKKEVYTKEEIDSRAFNLQTFEETIKIKDSVGVEATMNTTYYKRGVTCVVKVVCDIPRNFAKNGTDNGVYISTVGSKKFFIPFECVPILNCGASASDYGSENKDGLTTTVLLASVGRITVLISNSVDESIYTEETYPSYTKEFHIETYMVKDFTCNNILGDINQDGAIDENDLNLINEYLSEEAHLNNTQKLLADINKDGKIDAMDTYKLQQYLANGTPLE